MARACFAITQPHIIGMLGRCPKAGWGLERWKLPQYRYCWEGLWVQMEQGMQRQREGGSRFPWFEPERAHTHTHKVKQGQWPLCAQPVTSAAVFEYLMKLHIPMTAHGDAHLCFCTSGNLQAAPGIHSYQVPRSNPQEKISWLLSVDKAMKKKHHNKSEWTEPLSHLAADW